MNVSLATYREAMVGVGLCQLEVGIYPKTTFVDFDTKIINI